MAVRATEPAEIVAIPGDRRRLAECLSQDSEQQRIEITPLLLDLDAPQDPLRLVHRHVHQIILEVDPQAARFDRPSDSPILGRLHEVLPVRRWNVPGRAAEEGIGALGC